MPAKIPIGILGATGTVGQRFIQLLENHPWFEVAWLAASDRSSGKSYAEACKWKLQTDIPARIAKMTMNAAEPSADAPRVIFAALDSAAAKEIEPRFAAAGHIVITNSSALRMQEDVPLMIPEVNGDHMALIDTQAWRTAAKKGFVVTNPNCSAIGLVMALAPLMKFGIEKVAAVTMQAVSGAGYPGVASLDILGNVIPYIASEEEKMEAETKRLLGSLSGNKVVPADFKMTAHCNRVAVEDGHTESVSIGFKSRPTREQMLDAWRESSKTSKVAGLGLPSAPKEWIHYDERQDRPQPRLDIHRGRGMVCTIGRLRECGLLDWKFTVLSHNTVRGAAGAAILNAELLKVKGYLD